MKIVRITTLLDFGGQEKKYISFTDDSTLLKNEYFFAAIGYGGFAEKNLRLKGFNVTIFNKNPKITNIRNIILLYKWFKKMKPDVVHTAAAEANFHGTIAARLAGVKVIITEEIGLPSHSRIAKIVFKLIYRISDKTICVSKAVQSFLIDLGEIKENKGIVIYNPVSHLKKIEKNTSENFTIVCVGRLEKVKNQQLLIKAFSKLSILNAKLILVGDGKERNNLELLIEELKCADKIEIIGFSAEPEKYLAQANLFVLPSLSEGFGIAVLEAMQLGLPCLCSNVGGIPEFIKDKETGWLFNPTNENEFFEKLSSVCLLPNHELEKIGNQAKNYISTKFTQQEYVSNLENLYLELYD